VSIWRAVQAAHGAFGGDAPDLLRAQQVSGVACHVDVHRSRAPIASSSSGDDGAAEAVGAKKGSRR